MNLTSFERSGCDIGRQHHKLESMVKGARSASCHPKSEATRSSRSETFTSEIGSSFSMRSFLEFPREVRGRIYFHIIKAPISPPERTSNWKNRKSLRLHSYVMYQEHVKRSDTLSLLQLNRKVYKEALEATQLLPNRCNFKLDIMFVTQTYLWPTWLYVPTFTTKVGTLSVDLRVMGTHLPAEAYQRGLPFGKQNPPTVILGLHGFLKQFLTHGIGQKRELSTTLSKSGTQDDERIVIQNLNLNIVTSGMEGEWDANSPWLSKEEYFHDVSICIAKWIDRFLCMGYYTANYGMLLYERVGTIKITLEGNEFAGFNLGNRLNEVKFANSFGGILPRKEREPAFKGWKSGAFNDRVELELPTVPFSGTEALLADKERRRRLQTAQNKIKITEKGAEGTEGAIPLKDRIKTNIRKLYHGNSFVR